MGAGANIIQTRHALSTLASGREATRPPSAFRPIHHEKSGPLQAAPLCFPISAHSGALQRLRVKNLGVSPVGRARDHGPAFEVHDQKFAHLPILKSAPQRPVSVSAT